MAETPAEALEPFRRYLEVLARVHLDVRLRGKLGRAAARNEELLRLVNALADRAEPMREVVVRKHLRGCTLAQIGEQIGRSVPVVASLLRRGLEELRHRLAPKE